MSVGATKMSHICSKLNTLGNQADVTRISSLLRDAGDDEDAKEGEANAEESKEAGATEDEAK
jgi:hypothetical protein